MQTITYDLLKPIIIEEREDNGSLYCKFKTTGSHEIIEASAYLQHLENVKSQVVGQVKQSLWSGLSNLVSGLFSNSTLGNIAGNISGNVVQNAQNQDYYSYSVEEKKAGAVKAFESVADKFHWDTESKTWKLAKALNPFVQQIRANPFVNAYDREIFARMLTEIAFADGSATVEEENMIAGMIGNEFGSINDLHKKERLSENELKSVSAGSAVIMYMVASAVSLVDEEENQAETQRVTQIGEALGLVSEEMQQARYLAQSYILENLVKDQNYTTAMVHEKASRLGISADIADQIVIEYKRRIG